MAEQLSLRLEPAFPRPADVAPMWPVPLADPFDSVDFLFEPTWGGHRALAYLEPDEEQPDEQGGSVQGGGERGGGVRILDATGRDLAGRLPELAGLATRVAARSAVLDGELVVVDRAGLPDVGALQDRIGGRGARAVAFLVFDLLHVDGTWLLNRPLERRRELLRRVLRPGDEVVVVPAIAGEGRALHAAVVAQGIAGVLARRRTSPYLPGVRSMLWRSIAASSNEAGGEVAAAGSVGDAVPGEPGAAAGTRPVLALFRRLPLGEEAAEP
jgi:bifunctional non-homologous end joining protein LigD